MWEMHGKLSSPVSDTMIGDTREVRNEVSAAEPHRVGNYLFVETIL